MDCGGSLCPACPLDHCAWRPCVWAAGNTVGGRVHKVVDGAGTIECSVAAQAAFPEASGVIYGGSSGRACYAGFSLPADHSGYPLVQASVHWQTCVFGPRPSCAVAGTGVNGSFGSFGSGSFGSGSGSGSGSGLEDGAQAIGEAGGG